jgi:hypothetical protein
MERPYRPFKVRRSCRAVPASSDPFIEKVRGFEARGAVMLGDEMIDEASHKMAQAIVAKGRAAGLPS